LPNLLAKVVEPQVGAVGSPVEHSGVQAARKVWGLVDHRARRPLKACVDCPRRSSVMLRATMQRPLWMPSIRLIVKEIGPKDFGITRTVRFRYLQVSLG
jgi:hypothetical protein